MRWWARLAATVATLAVLVWRVGTGPFLDGLRMVDGEALAAAAGLGAALGVATAVVYGVMVFVASLPGAAVLVAARRTGAAHA